MEKLNRLKSNHHGNHVEKYYFKIELIKMSDEFEFIYKRKSVGKIISCLHAVIIVLSFPFGMYSSTQLYDQ